MYDFNRKFNKVLDSYIDIEARKVSSYIVNESLREFNGVKINDYLSINDSRLSYNVENINKFKSDFLKIIQNKISKVEYGNYEDYPNYIKINKNKYKHIKTGYLCEININSLNGISLLSNVGPNIPVKLSFLGDVSIDIDTKIKDYGINNVIVQLYVVVSMNNQITLPMNSRIQKVKVRELVSVDIIKGSVPDYYSIIK